MVPHCHKNKAYVVCVSGTREVRVDVLLSRWIGAGEPPKDELSSLEVVLGWACQEEGSWGRVSGQYHYICVASNLLVCAHTHTHTHTQSAHSET